MADLNPAQMQDEREKVRTALASRVTGKCPRCGTMEFTLLDGYFIFPLSPPPTAPYSAANPFPAPPPRA